MSHHFREMRVGDKLAVKGPKVLLVHMFSLLDLSYNQSFYSILVLESQTFFCFITFYLTGKV